MSHDATLKRIDDPVTGSRVVVTHADPIIWIHPDLLAEAVESEQDTITGGLVRDGELIHFGTPGEGMGRVTYRLTGYIESQHSYYVAHQETEGSTS
jgi:hypothetical protein